MLYFHPYLGNDPIWRAYFSDGLKPPTRWPCAKKAVRFSVVFSNSRSCCNTALPWICKIEAGCGNAKVGRWNCGLKRQESCVWGDVSGILLPWDSSPWKTTNLGNTFPTAFLRKSMIWVLKVRIRSWFTSLMTTATPHYDIVRMYVVCIFPIPTHTCTWIENVKM